MPGSTTRICNKFYTTADLFLSVTHLRQKLIELLKLEATDRKEQKV
jgi:hypothetical protein